ncbi:hypothetical protein Fmac_025275 [Flemingia macrophylla]|uniref:SAWADEE domain-containing protein n=1 Tax=Flemingia macrophylla TaxID=520843 RepID=A0ABD1LRR5_9FABA
MAREEMELFSSGSVSTPKGVSHLEMVSCWSKSSNTFGGTGYFERIENENQCAWQSDVKFCRPEVICYDMEDRDLEGIKNVCMILIANIDRELRPSTVKEFLHRHTSVSASVFIFPSLSLEVYTRGAIMLHSEKQFQEMCDFLNNPNYFITSSSGRPWVILEKLVGLKKIKASIGTPLRISKVALI